MYKKPLALLACLLLAVTACSTNNTAEETNSTVLSPTTPHANQTQPTEYNAPYSDFLSTPDGLNFQILAYKIAVAWLRGDTEALTQYIPSPEFERTLQMGFLDNRFDELEYMLIMLPQSMYDITENEIYTAIYQFMINGEDSVSFIDIELMKTADGWQAEWVLEQK